MELYLKTQNTPSFPGIQRNKVLMDHSRSIEQSEFLGASFSGLVKSKEKIRPLDSSGNQPVFNISMSS